MGFAEGIAAMTNSAQHIETVQLHGKISTAKVDRIIPAPQQGSRKVLIFIAAVLAAAVIAPMAVLAA